MNDPVSFATEFHPSSSPIFFVELAILTLLVITSIAMLRMRRLFGVVMLSGIYSFLSAAFFVALDAVDVAFTEAAVGAGISTVLMLSAMLLTARREKPYAPGHAALAAVVCVIVGGALIYATLDAPPYGDAAAPANSYVGQAYVERSAVEISMPNIVTTVLASYRGFDTMGEVAVIFTAGLAVMLLLGIGSDRGGKDVRDVPRMVGREEDGPGLGEKPTLDDGGKSPSPKGGAS